MLRCLSTSRRDSGNDQALSLTDINGGLSAQSVDTGGFAASLNLAFDPAGYVYSTGGRTSGFVAMVTKLDKGRDDRMQEADLTKQDWREGRRLCDRKTCRAVTGFLSIVLLTALVTVFHSAPAEGRPSPAHHRALLASEIREVFQRMFFQLWLGDPISLRGLADCSKEQLLRALSEKESFPSTFVSESGEPRASWNLCNPVRRKFDDARALRFDLSVPRITSCEDYSRRWSAFVSQRLMTDAIRPFAAPEQTFDKYNIPRGAQSCETARPLSFRTCQ